MRMDAFPRNCGTTPCSSALLAGPGLARTGATATAERVCACSGRNPPGASRPPVWRRRCAWPAHSSPPSIAAALPEAARPNPMPSPTPTSAAPQAQGRRDPLRRWAGRSRRRLLRRLEHRRSRRGGGRRSRPVVHEHAHRERRARGRGHVLGFASPRRDRRNVVIARHDFEHPEGRVRRRLAVDEHLRPRRHRELHPPELCLRARKPFRLHRSAERRAIFSFCTKRSGCSKR